MVKLQWAFAAIAAVAALSSPVAVEAKSRRLHADCDAHPPADSAPVVLPDSPEIGGDADDVLPSDENKQDLVEDDEEPVIEYPVEEDQDDVPTTPVDETGVEIPTPVDDDTAAGDADTVAPVDGDAETVAPVDGGDADTVNPGDGGDADEVVDDDDLVDDDVEGSSSGSDADADIVPIDDDSAGSNWKEPLPDHGQGDVTDEPVTQEPMPEEPVTEEPTPEEPVTQEPETEEPTPEEPVTQEPETEEPETEEPETEEPVTQEPETEEPETEAPVTEAPVTDAPRDEDQDDGLPLWVGPTVTAPTDTSCYRKTHRTKKCPPGYEFDKIATCWAECPLNYPVECGMECLPQNADCTKAILRKVTSVATVALNFASNGVFGKVADAAKGVQVGLRCSQQLFNVVKEVTGYVNKLEATEANTTESQLMFLLQNSDFATVSLPTAVSKCLGKPIPSSLDKADDVIKIVKSVFGKVVSAKKSGANLLDPATFLSFASDVGLGAATSSMKPTEVSSFKSFAATAAAAGSSASCTTQIGGIMDRATMLVEDIKEKDPNAAVDVIRAAVMASDLVLKDLPNAAASCFSVTLPDAFKYRDQVLKAAHILLDKVISSSENDSKTLSKAEYALKVTEMGLDAIATFDPTGLAAMAKEFVEPICGPTIFVGEVSDGPADQALGLNMVGKAFAESSGQWLKSGDGQVKITFRSVDNKDVKVNILNGGNKYAEVKVKKGETVTWTHAIADLKGKTMYLDRWRPGFLNIPGTGGGSLVTWIPDDMDGDLTLDVQINVS